MAPNSEKWLQDFRKVAPKSGKWLLRAGIYTPCTRLFYMYDVRVIKTSTYNVQEYSEPMLEFALTLHNISPKAYR